MSAALCFYCGGIKLGALSDCSHCGVGTTGNAELDVVFSDLHYTRETLDGFGRVIQGIRAVCDDDQLRYWAFLKYVSDRHPEIVDIRMTKERAAAVTALLSSLELPTVNVEPADGLR